MQLHSGSDQLPGSDDVQEKTFSKQVAVVQSQAGKAVKKYRPDPCGTK